MDQQPSQPQSFSFHLPSIHHPQLRVKLSELGYVKLHTEKKAGHVAPPEALGLEYDYTVEGDTVSVTITHNPHNVSNDTLKAKIGEALNQLSGHSVVAL